MFVNEHEVYSQWSSENIIDPKKTVIGSHKIALWVCEKFHTFEMAVRNRINDIECSYCSGKKKIAGVNDLSALYPEIHRELSPNNKVDITEIAPKSSKKLLWICNKNHEYKMTPNKRTSDSSGCPYCSNNRILQGFNDLATTNPELLKDWDFSKNLLKPTEVFAKGAKKYWWLCEKGHSFDSHGGKRIEGKGCPYCNRGKLLVGFNDLLTKYPDIATDWDSKKNEILPHQIIAGSGYMAWWLCSEGHSWQASLANRTSKSSGCPDCSRRVSKGEIEVRRFTEKLLQKDSMSSSRKIIPPYELDIYFPDENLAIEFNGTFWHSDSQVRKTHDISAKEYHQNKVDLCKEKDIDLVFVWQHDWKSDSDEIKSALREFVKNRGIMPKILTKLEGELPNE